MREGRNGGKLKTGNTKNVGRKRELPELDKLLADVLGEEKDGITAGEAILKALRAKATKGDVRAAEVLLDRAYGKAKQHIENTITTTTPLVITLDKSELNSEADSSI
jgi:tagatose-1,6-bisphosphate aldolase